MAHLPYHAFHRNNNLDRASQQTQPNSQKADVKYAMYVHAIRLQQTRVDLSEYRHCSDRYPGAICTPDVILLHRHVTNHKASGEGAPLTTFNFRKLHNLYACYADDHSVDLTVGTICAGFTFNCNTSTPLWRMKTVLF